MEWNDAQPIYRQLRDLVMQRVLDGSFPEGESIPSVRQVAAEYRINHITVSKAYQELVDMGLLEKRRGLGMFVRSGAQAALSSEEKRRFLDEEVPALAARARTLGVAINTIVERLQDAGGEQHVTHH
ncbi:MAG TPA: GntR family transcriptional regulator [Halieaceae bacterium]|jgi:GntR family transcriptional regulator|nr:GntR family transcriptional regulator [Halieaceae bacterium]